MLRPDMVRYSLVAAVTLLVAALAGFVGAQMTREIYVPILAPTAMGAAIGCTLGFSVHVARVRAGWVVWGLALLAWMICVSVFHWTEYRIGFIDEVRQWYTLEGNYAGSIDVSSEEALVLSEDLLQEEVGRGGFSGFLLFRLRSGLRLRGANAELGALWAGLVWFLDLAIVLGLSVRIALGVQRRIPPSTATENQAVSDRAPEPRSPFS